MYGRTSRLSLPLVIIFKDVGHSRGVIVGGLQDDSVVMSTKNWTYIDVTR
jgi:hypothetical protein